MNSAVYTLVHRSLYTIRVFYLHISVPVPSIVNIGHAVQVTLCIWNLLYQWNTLIVQPLGEAVMRVMVVLR